LFSFLHTVQRLIYMQPLPRASDVTREAAALCWSELVDLHMHTGQAHEVLSVLGAFGVAAASNQQLAVCLQTRGDAALIDFQLYARSESAAFGHYLLTLHPVLARTGTPFHNPAEIRRLARLAVDKFVASLSAKHVIFGQTAQHHVTRHTPTRAPTSICYPTTPSPRLVYDRHFFPCLLRCCGFPPIPRRGAAPASEAASEETWSVCWCWERAR